MIRATPDVNVLASGFLLPGDKHLQRIDHYQGMIILSPRQFLDVLEVAEYEA